MSKYEFVYLPFTPGFSYPNRVISPVLILNFVIAIVTKGDPEKGSIALPRAMLSFKKPYHTRSNVSTSFTEAPGRYISSDRTLSRENLCRTFFPTSSCKKTLFSLSTNIPLGIVISPGPLPRTPVLVMYLNVLRSNR